MNLISRDELQAIKLAISSGRNYLLQQRARERRISHLKVFRWFSIFVNANHFPNLLEIKLIKIINKINLFYKFIEYRYGNVIKQSKIKLN